MNNADNPYRPTTAIEDRPRDGRKALWKFAAFALVSGLIMMVPGIGVFQASLDPNSGVPRFGGLAGMGLSLTILPALAATRFYLRGERDKGLIAMLALLAIPTLIAIFFVIANA